MIMCSEGTSGDYTLMSLVPPTQVHIVYACVLVSITLCRSLFVGLVKLNILFYL